MLTLTESDSLELFVSGSNSHGQLGVGHIDDLDRFTLAQRWPTSTEVLSFAAGARHSLLLIRNRINGSNGFPKLFGTGDRSNHQLPIIDATHQTEEATQANSRFVELSYSSLISSIQSIDIKLRDQLLTAYQPTKVASSWETSFVVLQPLSCQKESSVVVAFGSNDFGLRGTRSGTLPNLISQPNLVEFNMSSQSLITIEDLVGGPKHMVAIVSLRTTNSNSCSVEVIGWGAARHGQLGRSNPEDKLPRTLPPGRIAIPFELPQDPSLVKIGVGKEHTVIMCPGHICSLGSQKHGQDRISEAIGLENEILAVQCCWNTTFLLKRPSEYRDQLRLIGYGNNTQAQLGSLDSKITVLQHTLDGTGSVAVAVGSEHVLVSDQPELVYGWGWNEHGNLGSSSNVVDGDAMMIKAREVIWRARDSQKVVNLFAGCATSFLWISNHSSS